MLTLLGILLAGCVQMNEATIRPNADVVQGWQQVPSDGQAHYLKVDEPFDSFDSADYLWDSGGFTPEQIGFGVLPGDIDESVTVRLRAYAWSDDPVASLGLLFDVDGEQIADGNAGWDFSALALSTWHPIDVVLGTFPVLHGGETILLLPVGTASIGGTIRLGQVELVVTYIQKKGLARGRSGAPSAELRADSAAAGGESAAPSSVAESRAVESLASAEEGIARAAGAAAGPTASGSIASPKATPQAPGTVFFSVSSGAPRAAVASAAPVATTAAPAVPRGDGQE